MKFILLISDKP